MKTVPDKPAARSTHEELPHKISEFITNNFRGEFLSDIKKIRDKRGKDIYDVSISHDNTLHHLRFNALGVLIERNAEPLMELYEEDEIDEID
ncbi:MAG: hypothetical protein PSX36_09845 [bacterium]|nr:hypothetical protein [bacterium]